MNCSVVAGWVWIKPIAEFAKKQLDFKFIITICCSDEIIILSAMGTAARVNMNLEHMALLSRLRSHAIAVPPDRQSAEREREKDKEKEKHLFVDVNLANQASQHRITTAFDTWVFSDAMEWQGYWSGISRRFYFEIYVRFHNQLHQLYVGTFIYENKPIYLN